MRDPLSPAQLAGRTVAAVVMVAGIVGAVVDSGHWFAFALAIAWPFWAIGGPPS